MNMAFVSKDCTPPAGRAVASGGRLFPMDEPPQGRLLARIALLQQDGQTACICCTDQKIFRHHVADQIRSTISRECGIPIENIMLAASHTHSVPDLVPIPLGVQKEAVGEFSFVDEYAGWLVDGVREAQAKLEPVSTWKGATGPTATMGICRRPLYKLEDGSIQAATQASRDCHNFAGLDGRDEDSLTVLAACGSNGVAGGFVNYACHPTTQYGTPFYTADYPGAFYEYMDQKDIGIFLYANGPCGNVGNRHFGAECSEQMGKTLSEDALLALKNGAELSPGQMRVAWKTLDIPRRKPTPEQVQYAKDFLSKDPSQQEIDDFTRRMYGVQYHMGGNPLSLSQGLCRQLLMLNDEIQQGVDTEQVRLQVIALGKDVAFIGVSAEMFNQFTDLINAKSPFTYNCIMGLTNGWNGYIPTTESYPLGGYECCLSQINRLASDAFDRVAEETVALLKRLYPSFP